MMRDSKEDRVADFLRGKSPTDLKYLRWSYEYDPPADTLLRALIGQVATLTAAFYNANKGKDSRAVAAKDFLPTWDDTPADAPAESAGSPIDEVTAARAARDDLRAGLGVDAGRPIAPLLPNPRARPVPAHIWAAVTGGDEG